MGDRGTGRSRIITRSQSVLLKVSVADEAAGEEDEGVVEFGAAFPADGDSFEVWSGAKVCSTTYRSLPMPLMFGDPLREMTSRIRRRRSRLAGRSIQAAHCEHHPGRHDRHWFRHRALPCVAQARAARAENGEPAGETVLFFECRHPDWDDLYADGLALYPEAARLQLHRACSREPDGGIRYVQHRLWQQRRTVFDLGRPRSAHIRVRRRDRHGACRGAGTAVDRRGGPGPHVARPACRGGPLRDRPLLNRNSATDNARGDAGLLPRAECRYEARCSACRAAGSWFGPGRIVPPAVAGTVAVGLHLTAVAGGVPGVRTPRPLSPPTGR